MPPPLAGEALEPLALSKSFIADKTFPLEPPLVRGGAPKERRGCEGSNQFALLPLTSAASSSNRFKLILRS